MPHKPEHASKSRRQAAERPFVGRGESTAPVHDALKALQRTKPLVLVYYGGAGIGKSRLRRELARQFAAGPGVLTATLDFDIPAYRQPNTALLFLRNALHETYQTRFHSFDIAYAVLWQQSHPEAALGDDLKPLLEPGSHLSQLLDESGRLPLVGLVPRITKSIRGQGIQESRGQVKESGREETQGSEGAADAGPLESSNPRPLDPPLRSWWERRGELELEDLPQMEPNQILDILPKLWASDLREFLVPRWPQRPLSDSTSLIVDRRAVLFIDSYEKLWETGAAEADFFKRDEWVRELVKQLPEALWVFCGRQKLRWEEVNKEWSSSLSQHELGALPEESARKFLSSCGITNEPIQDAIVKGSQGVPHYLDLAVDTVQSTKSQVPVSSFQGENPEELQKEFIRHLNQPEVEALQVLSAPRFWYYELFENLMAEYQTGYPVTAYEDLARFSFIKEGAAPGTRTMHDLMREALQEEQSPELRKRVHLSLHELYAKQLQGLDVKSIAEKHKTALTEAFYHGRQAKSAAETWPWLKDVVAVFEEAGLHRLLLPLFREEVRALESEAGPSHPDTTAGFCHIAESFAHLDEYAEAETLERRVLATNEKTLGPEHPLVGDNLHDLAATLSQQGRFNEAELLFGRALAIKEKSLGPAHIGTAGTLRNMASVAKEQAKYVVAEPLYRRALAIYEETLGPNDEQVAHTLEELAGLLMEEGKHADAEQLRRRALAITEETLGPEHPEAARIQGNLAGLLCSEGKYKEAEPLARRSLATMEKMLGPEHSSVAHSLWALSRALTQQNRQAEAEPLMRRALAIWEKRLGPDHRKVALGLDSLAIILEEQHKCAEAEPLYRRSLTIREKTLGPEHPDVGVVLNNLGMVLADQHRYAEAESSVRRALAVWEKALGPGHPNLACGLDTLGKILREQHRFAEAEPLVRRALAIMEHALGPDHPAVPDYLDSLGRLLFEQSRYSEAEPFARRALAVREGRLGSDNPGIVKSLDFLARVHEQTGRTAEAQDLSARAKAIREKNTQTAQAQAPSPS